MIEFCSEGTLFDLLLSQTKFDETQARFYFQQLMEALEHMHKQGIGHRDLKPENLLLDSDKNLKVCDFGLASTQSVAQTIIGTESYMAPEIMSG